VHLFSTLHKNGDILTMIDVPEPMFDARPLIDQYARWRRRGALLVWGALMIALALTILIGLLEQSTSPPKPNVNKIGVHLLMDDGRKVWDEALWWHHISYAGQIVGTGGIVIQVIRQDDLDRDKWQYFMDSCLELDMLPVLRLATTVDREKGVWRVPQADADGRYHTVAAQYADFVASLDWRGMTPQVIILNEPNNGIEWGGKPDAAAYARLFVDVAQALREAVPTIQILNAALDLYAPHTGSQPFADGLFYVDANSFLDAMVAAEPTLLEQIDIWNNHSYPMGAFIQPPWEQQFHFDAMHDAMLNLASPPPAHIRNRGVNGYEWELWKLAQFGVNNLPVMITETGWRYHSEHAVLNADADYPDAATAAQYLDMALRGNAGRYPQYPRTGWTPWLHDERVMGVAFFALNGTPDEWGHSNLLIMNADGSVAGTTPLFDMLATLQLE
jgi:hypothetical protein